jgi:hypothetical protein
VLGEAQAGEVLVDVAEHQLDLCHHVAADRDAAADRCALLGQLLDRRAKRDCVAGPDQSVKRRPADLCEDHLLGEVAGLADQDAGRLRHAFDDQAVWDDREAGVEVVEVLLGQRHVLHRRRRRPRRELHELVDPDPPHRLGRQWSVMATD